MKMHLVFYEVVGPMSRSRIVLIESIIVSTFYVSSFRRFYKTSKMIYVLVSAKNVEYFDDRRKMIYDLVTKREKRYSDEKSKFDVRMTF